MTIDFRLEGKVAIYTINRTARRNALDKATLNELQRQLAIFENDPRLLAGVITGAGEQSFCCGLDIEEFSEKGPPPLKVNQPGNPMRGLEITKPLIAAVNGAALGGGLELMLICDLRIASETAVFGFPETKLGLIPGWGGTQRLLRQITWCQAAELLLTGENIDAQSALRMGLINRVAPQSQVLPLAVAVAKKICLSAPLAVRAAKEAMLKGVQVSFDEGLQIEDALNCHLKTTEDFHEGTAAFKAKRPPHFEGR